MKKSFITKSRVRRKIVDSWLDGKLSSECFERLIKGEILQLCKGDDCECQK